MNQILFVGAAVSRLRQSTLHANINMHACSPHYSPYFSYGCSWEKLLEHRQDSFSLVIRFSLFALPGVFDQVVILLEAEMRCLLKTPLF